MPNLLDEGSSADVESPSPVPDTTNTQPPPRKRQLFKNRPAWSSQHTNTSSVAKAENGQESQDDPLRAFSRANHTFRYIQEAEERARQDKAKESEDAEKKEREEKRKMKERELAMYAKLTKNFESPARKKRRLSEQIDGNDQQNIIGPGDDVVIMEEKVHKAKEDGVTETGYATPPRSRSVRSTVTPRSSRKTREHGVVELLDGVENNVSTPSRRSRRTSEPNDDNSEEHKTHQLSPAPALTSAPTFTIDDDDDHPHAYQPSQSNRPSISRTPSIQQAAPQQPPPPALPNPILSLLIHSSIPNTTPLLVKRRLNQRLKEVRLAWINKQINESLPPHPEFPVETEKIFLTWRNKRCYDFTSCASLGLIVDELTGEVVVKRKDSDLGSGNMGPGASGMSVTEEREWKDAMADGGAQLVLEAVTEEVLTKRKKGVNEKGKNGADGRAPLGASMSATETSMNVGATQAQSTYEQSQPPPPEQPSEDNTAIEPKIKIILRAGKEYEDYKLQVRPVSLYSSTLSQARLTANSSKVNNRCQSCPCLP